MRTICMYMDVCMFVCLYVCVYVCMSRETCRRLLLGLAVSIVFEQGSVVSRSDMQGSINAPTYVFYISTVCTIEHQAYTLP